MNRKFVPCPLGGVRDEAEIRGQPAHIHWLLPGRIIQAMKRAGVVNPLILLDEVDKLGADWRGDPRRRCSRFWIPSRNTTLQRPLPGS